MPKLQTSNIAARGWGELVKRICSRHEDKCLLLDQYSMDTEFDVASQLLDGFPYDAKDIIRGMTGKGVNFMLEDLPTIVNRDTDPAVIASYTSSMKQVFHVFHELLLRTHSFCLIIDTSVPQDHYSRVVMGGIYRGALDTDVMTYEGIWATYFPRPLKEIERLNHALSYPLDPSMIQLYVHINGMDKETLPYVFPIDILAEGFLYAEYEDMGISLDTENDFLMRRFVSIAEDGMGGEVGFFTHHPIPRRIYSWYPSAGRFQLVAESFQQWFNQVLITQRIA